MKLLHPVTNREYRIQVPNWSTTSFLTVTKTQTFVVSHGAVQYPDPRSVWAVKPTPVVVPNTIWDQASGSINNPTEEKREKSNFSLVHC